MKITLLASLCISYVFAFSLFAGDTFAGGRIQAQGHFFEVYGGYGELNSLSGQLQETRNGSQISGGLNTDFNQLGIEDGTESLLLGASLTGKWITLLVDYRQNSINASGTADSEIRLNVDQVVFNGNNYEYLLIPVNSQYTLKSDTNLLGIGLRFTPITVNPKGAVRFTPWIHLGVQYIDTSFDLDSKNEASLEASGFNSRTYVVNGRASGSGQLIIPEIGAGGEIRFLFHDHGNKGPELSTYATYKILDLEGSLDSIGVQDDEFDRLKVSYTALEIGANFYYPLGDSVDLLLGLYLEQVETNTVLSSKPSAGDFQRKIDLDYTLYGLRAGLRF